MAIHQLIYISTATQPFDAAALRALLAQARAHNHAQGLTGILLYCDGLFLQVLEGEATAVHALYANRISHDPRHHQLRLLADAPVPGTSFPDWSMGFLPEFPDELRPGSGYLNPATPGFLAAQAPELSPKLQALLQRFVAVKSPAVSH